MDEFPFEPQKEYYTLVGYLITKYAAIEFTLRRILCDVSGMSDEHMNVFIENPRSSDLIKKVRKIIKTYLFSDDAIAAMTDAFAQLAEITKLRDRVVHYGSMPLSREKTIVFAKGVLPKNLTHSETSLENIWFAGCDLELINNIFIYRSATDNAMFPDKPSNCVRCGSWQYTPL